VAAFIGSWTFIIGQAVLMVIWCIVNTLALFHVIQFDAYPFVFLNLFMSAEAAFSTPLILMSQNRQAERDRHQAEDDYRTNIEAKQEIEELQIALAKIEADKLDRIIAHLGIPTDAPLQPKELRSA
jgi:uncharacterized membrane protein